MRTANVLEHFHEIDVFKKTLQRSSILSSLLKAKTASNREKTVLKNMLFLNLEFYAFFCGSDRFWLDLGRPRPLQKMAKNQKDREQIDFGAHLKRIGCSMVALGGFWERFGKVLGWFWDGFGQDFSTFWLDFA